MLLGNTEAVVLFDHWALFLDQNRIGNTTVVDVVDQCRKDDGLPKTIIVERGLMCK